ncbi:MAG: tyrosine-type recombinase/integrase [Methylococcaceae bacterium]|nr:tyrosine-type recombinase/integrase [Methylococcaceae bacterium]MDZ4099777.1 tyrosine-type recombinase/integrase [Methylophilaceae bacterium]MDP2394990.1 tyrosine-type recombinase/integrase [Methylococcaceae bacterium]MDP3019516.1 tyrosine-type recombinase/integrase [Methylococcaceae bacterium]MDP3389506.1 tyrosine-type recombinase/integrase [Methylococcaceae bacterium]
MNTRITLQTHATNYLNERRQLGFGLRTPGYSILSFARYVDALNSQAPLTVELMADWARQDQGNTGKPSTWARRLKNLRSFCRYLQQFEPRTEVPDDSIFGRIGQRLTPHIYSEQEIIDLLAAAHKLDSYIPGLRAATYETLFGLIASTGLRVSEALHLLDLDVDLKSGLLNIRKTKFAKSRYVPLHPSTLEALRQYQLLRNRYIQVSDESRFFVGARGRRLGQPLSLKQVDRVFISLRSQLGWINRGAHNGPRIHDLRHTFIVRRVLLWQAQGLDVDQQMLALSTYVGHAMVTNTYWYLTGIPELMAGAADKFDAFAHIPEVSHD